MPDPFRSVRTGPTPPLDGRGGAAAPACPRGPGRAGPGGPALTGARSSTAACRGRWEAEPDGATAAEVGPFRLVVHPGAPGGCARFLVLRYPGGGRGRSPALLASGHGDDAEAAMHAAERTAARLAGDAGRVG